MTTPVETDVRRELVAGCRIMDGERLTDAFGHLSARGGDGDAAVWITARVGPGLVTDPDELLGATADAEVVSGDPKLMPGEAAIHFGLLKARPDVNAVVRFHGPGCMAFSSLGIPLPTTIGIALAFGGPVPVFDTALTVTTPAAAGALAETLGGGTAVLLRGFGAVTVGPSVGEAVVRATLLERSAQAVLAARATGEPLQYTQAQADAFVARTAVVNEQLARAWAYFKRRHPAPRD